MKRSLVQLFSLMMVFCSIEATAIAASVKVHVAEFTISGASNKDELKGVLHGLLASRLASDKVAALETSTEVDAQVVCSYVSLGKMFSIDAAVRSSTGEVIGRSYVQGDGQDDLIPAIGRLAQQLHPILLNAPLASPSQTTSQLLTKQAPAAELPGVPAQVVPKAAIIATPAGDIIRAEKSAVVPSIPQTRIEGALLGIAPGRELAGGDREFVLAGEKSVFLYRQGKELKKIGELQLAGEAKILGVDTSDLDNDGILEAYVTIIEGEALASRMLAVSDEGLTTVADRLPYYFRALALEGKGRRIYAQQIGQGKDDFYGEVREVIKSGNSVKLGNAVAIPKGANLFTFNRFVDTSGRMHQLQIDEDGYLRVFDGSGELLWKSGDRYGGTEVFFKRDEQQMQPVSDDRYRWRFLEQRLVVTENGLIIVPRNKGLFVVGNNRSYTNNTVFAYTWTGVSLDEQWRTKESQNYLADYFMDDRRKELVMLEVVKKEGLFSKGASTITVKKVE